MSGTIAFWSYSRHDDEAEGGRISRLARDLGAELTMTSGVPTEVWLDLDHLDWGAPWHEEVGEALRAVAYFIPVLTPRFFQRVECRRELNVFTRGGRQDGRVVLPLLYLDYPSARSSAPDPAVALVNRYQFRDWRELRFESPESGVYRRGVHAVARALVDSPALDPALCDNGETVEVLTANVLRGVLDVSAHLHTAHAAIRSAGGNSTALVTELGDTPTELVHTAHVLNGDVYALRAALTRSQEHQALARELGKPLHEVFRRHADLAESLEKMGTRLPGAQHALEAVRLGVLLAADCHHTAAHWSRGS
ncbi:toll/interleukin-1 receptor domain-containing protein [Actinokineospora bangkokensis]|uniref:TIR domain-containing protein n=1 Tax=Actinokineospora bangkokensis TaxID=1193682 RepID=A0A1Q9LN63_9PSEU|nr:toll/interleukin-1 receptor domain-containing protein [Actinokineospora bangkokensis]OLR93451.1 hypothetical protein BJP25_14170 [Actinokineospora bangkokensis]